MVTPTQTHNFREYSMVSLNVTVFDEKKKKWWIGLTFFFDDQNYHLVWFVEQNDIFTIWWQQLDELYY